MDRRDPMLAPAAPHPDAHLQRWIRLGLGSVLSLIFIILALRGVPLEQLGDALLSVNPFWALVALICVNAVNVVKAIRWQIILRPQAPDVSLRRLFAVLMIGQGMNAFAPLRVGDVARAYMIEGVGVGTVLYSVVVEKALDSLALLGLIAGVAVVMPLPSWLKQSGVLLSLTLVAVLGLLLLAGRGSRYMLSAGVWIERALPPFKRLAVARRIASASGILQSLSQRRLLGRLVLWTILSWLLGTAANYVTFLAMNTPAQTPILASTFLIVVLYLGAIVPSSPGKVGVFHYLVVISLALFAVDKGPALAYAVILHLIVYGPTALLGGYYVWRESQTRGRTSTS